MDTYGTQIGTCIEKCLHMAENSTRQNSIWFENYRKRHNISSLQELDQEIFFRMYGRKPHPHEVQKIRFWRLKQHLPKNREESIRLGQALGLSGYEMDCFLTGELHSQRLTPVKNRKEMTEALFYQYLCRIPRTRLEKLHIKPGTQQKHIRHIFYTEALDCLDVEQSIREHCYKEHLYSRNFAGEFKKYLLPDAIISRENMLRLLIILLLPDIDEKTLNEWLDRFGHAPLRPYQEVNGYADLAVKEILDLLQSVPPKGLAEDKEHMKMILRQYDRAVKKKCPAKKQYLRKLRFMKFHSMDNDNIK